MIDMLNELVRFAFSPFGIWLPMLMAMVPVVIWIDRKHRKEDARMDRIWERLNRERSK